MEQTFCAKEVRPWIPDHTKRNNLILHPEISAPIPSHHETHRSPSLLVRHAKERSSPQPKLRHPATTKCSAMSFVDSNRSISYYGPVIVTADEDKEGSSRKRKRFDKQKRGLHPSRNRDNCSKSMLCLTVPLFSGESKAALFYDISE
jgi:hypothetical protein